MPRGTMTFSVQFSSLQSLSRVQLFATLWIAARQASLSITNSWSSPSSRWCHPAISSSVIPFSSCPQSLSIRVFSSESVLRIRWPKYWSFSFSIMLPMNIQDWFPLGWTGLISLQSKGLSRFFSNTTVSSTALSFLYDQLSHPYMTTGKNHSFD